MPREDRKERLAAARAERKAARAAGARHKTAGARIQESVEQSKQEDNRSNQEILENAIRKVAEASEIGANTMVQLSLQREQLLRIDDDLYTINQSLAGCERSIKGMSSLAGAFSNMFSAPTTSEIRHANGEIVRPKEINDQDQSAKLNVIFDLQQKGCITLKPGESLKYHYCNVNKPTFMNSNILSKCVLLTDMRLIKVQDDKLYKEVFLPDIESVTVEVRKSVKACDGLTIALCFHGATSAKQTLVFLIHILVLAYRSQAAGPFKCPQLQLRLKSGRGTTVNVGIWGRVQVQFFKDVIERIIKELSIRRAQRTDAELEAKAKEKQTQQRLASKPLLLSTRLHFDNYFCRARSWLA